MATLDQFQGCLLGLALGDALGAPHEGGFVERLVWRLIGKTHDGKLRWTDDTQMTIDLAESLLAKRQWDQDDLVQRFAASYRWSRGYGPGTAKLLKKIARGADWQTANRAIYREGSYGNGAAMRAPLLGLVYQEHATVLATAKQTAEITHANPLAIEGAQLVATVTRTLTATEIPSSVLQAADEVCTGQQFRSRLAIARTWLEAGHRASPAEVRKQLGNGIAAHESCVTAVYLALRFLNAEFQELLDIAIAVRGDVDTIAAMSGAMWGAYRGLAALPGILLESLEHSERIMNLAEQLHVFAQQ
jgi:poly(ADP-ribose) glycohydrolase ARH3